MEVLPGFTVYTENYTGGRQPYLHQAKLYLTLSLIY